MRKVIDAILVIIVIGASAFTYLYHDEISKKLRTAIYGLPCSKPITYSIGVVDPRFDLTKSEVESLVDKAADNWNKSSGKNLLQKAEVEGKVVIDFIFDERQQVTETLSTIKTTLSISEKELEVLKARYDNLRAKYLKDKAEYESMLQAYEKKQRDYTEAVRNANKRGGARKGEFEELNERRASLEEEFAILQSRLSSLNEITKELNGLAQTINGEVKDHNSTVATYNSVVHSQPREFEEGEFISDDKGMRINVYQFSDRNTLSRVLQHELGHALGLDHVEDEDSIMYPYNTGDALLPTESDLEELNRICTIR